MVGGPDVHWQRNAHDAGFAGLRRNDFELAVMRFDDLPADGQPESEPDVPRGEERGGRLSGGFGGKTGAVVLHLNLQILMAEVAFSVQLDSDSRFLGIGLQGIEHDLGQRVLEGSAVPGNDGGFAPVFAMQLRGFDRLMLARFLVGFLDQRLDREDLRFNLPVPGQETHLVDKPRDSPDPIGERMVERLAEFGVPVFFGQQLLMRREWHHGVADLVREAVGHGFDQAQVGRLNFQPAQLIALRKVFGGQQRGDGRGRIRPLERGDADAVNHAGRIFRLCAGL